MAGCERRGGVGWGPQIDRSIATRRQEKEASTFAGCPAFPNNPVRAPGGAGWDNVVRERAVLHIPKENAQRERCDRQSGPRQPARHAWPLWSRRVSARWRNPEGASAASGDKQIVNILVTPSNVRSMSKRRACEAQVRSRREHKVQVRVATTHPVGSGG